MLISFEWRDTENQQLNEKNGKVRLPDIFFFVNNSSTGAKKYDMNIQDKKKEQTKNNSIGKKYTSLILLGSSCLFIPPRAIMGPLWLLIPPMYTTRL